MNTATILIILFTLFFPPAYSRPIEMLFERNGKKIELMVKNCGSESIQFYDSLSEKPPLFVSVKARNMEGRILTITPASLDGYWCVAARISDSINPPVKLTTLKPNQALRYEYNIEMLLWGLKKMPKITELEIQIKVILCFDSTLEESENFLSDWLSAKAQK